MFPIEECYVKFRHDTYENCKNSDTILSKDEIFIVDDKQEMVLIGDGKSKILDCRRLDVFPEALSLRLVSKKDGGFRYLIKAIQNREIIKQ